MLQFNFFFLVTTRINNPERIRKIMQLKSYHHLLKSFITAAGQVSSDGPSPLKEKI